MKGGERFDVAVIGAGVVGAAIARECTMRGLGVVLIDAAEDVGAGTSKANTAILHTGFDATPGTIESRLVTRGYSLLKKYAAEAGIAVEETGALLVAWTPEQRDALPGIVDKAGKNGVTDVVPVALDALYELEPNLGANAFGALRVAGEGIICPFSPPIAYAYDAVANGATLRLATRIVNATHDQEGHRLEAADGSCTYARWVVNAAGLFSDDVDTWFVPRRFTITPRKGELIVYDKLARPLLSHVLLPVPTKTTKGVLVSPTVFGNVILGPTAEDLKDRGDTTTSEAGLCSLIDKGGHILPRLLLEEVTATYAGLRAATEHSDYQLFVDEAARYICVGGVRSTGLTASLAIAEYVGEAIGERGVPIEWKQMRVPYLGEAGSRPYQDAARIASDPAYGRILCHCERVTEGEVRDAMTSVIPARSLDGLRRRTRCLQGRCQGFFCLADITQALADETKVDPRALLGERKR